MQIIFWLAQKYGNHFLFLHKKLRPAQKSLKPVEGQGIRNLHTG